MQSLKSSRVKLALVFFVAIVSALVLSFFSSATPRSDAQVGYGPQNIPDQTIQPISHGSSSTGLALGVGVAVVILGGGVFVGWHRRHPAEHPYP